VKAPARQAASGPPALASRQALARVRHGLKDRFPASGMRVAPALRAGHRRIGRRAAKEPAVRRAASREAGIARRAGTTVNARRVALKVVASVANVLRVALMVNAAKARRADSKAAVSVLRAGTTVLVRPVSSKVAASVANALPVALRVNAARAHRAGLKAAATVVPVGTTVNVRHVGSKVAPIAANVPRVALRVNAAKAHRAGLKAVQTAVNAARAHPGGSKEAQIGANAHPAVSKVAAPRAVTTASAVRSAVPVRAQAVRRKAAHVASVRRATPRIAPVSAATVAPRRNAVAANADRAAIAHRAVLKASGVRQGVASALSRSPSKAATVIARTARRARRATTAANAHRPGGNSVIVLLVPATAANVATGANVRLATSTRHCRPPAAALATTAAPRAPTSRAARRLPPEPNATPTTPRASRVAITKTHRAPCACPS